MIGKTEKGKGWWLWAGIASLCISALCLALILWYIQSNPEEIGYIIVGPLAFTGIPIAIGVFCLEIEDRDSRSIDALGVGSIALSVVAMKVRESMEDSY